MKTCARCDSVQLHVNTVNGLAWAGCTRLDGDGAQHPMPQSTRPLEQPLADGSPRHAKSFKAWETVFLRVPMWCPRTDTHKTEPYQLSPDEYERRTWRVPGERIE